MRAKLLALIAGSAIALTAVAPATAAPVVYDNDTNTELENGYHFDCTWDDLNLDGNVNDYYDSDADINDEFTPGNCIVTNVDDLSLDISHFERYIGGDGTVTDGNGDKIGTFLDAPFCSSGWGVSLDDDATVTVEIDSHGDKVFIITGTYNGLDVVGELRMYSEQDLMRWHWTFTNNTGSASTNNVVTVTNGSSQDYSGDGTTSDGDQSWETGDWYGTMFDADQTASDGDRTAIATAFVGGNGEIPVDDIDSSDVITNGDELIINYNFDVADGENVELIYFLTSSDYEAGDAAIAADTVDPTVADFGDGIVQGRYARGLVDNDNSNWGTIIPEAEAELADTGADTSSLWAGLGLLVAGVAVVAVRRRARA